MKLNKMKSEKGSITLFVLITCIFAVIILLIANFKLTNKRTNQEKQTQLITKQYTVTNEEMENMYEKLK